jgi:PAS domain S-box-containing protein
MSHNSFTVDLLLHRITNRIRQSLELSEILSSTVVEVRALLGTDRVKVYQFYEDESGEVVAESIGQQRLPTLLGHSFPAGDIPLEARDMFRQAARSIVDVRAQQIDISSLGGGKPGRSTVLSRPVDACHVDYLTAMGVQSSLVVPILDGKKLWGLLVSHHSQPRSVTDYELQVMQLIADQVSVAIAQSNLLHQAQQRASQEAIISRIAAQLYSVTDMQVQSTLEEMITALQGSGGRLYMHQDRRQDDAPQDTSQWVTVGDQPVVIDEWSGEAQTGWAMEQHPHWQIWLDMEEPIAEGVWAIADLYKAEMPSDLAVALLSAQVRGLLIVRLQHQHQVLGYLSIFRREIDIERVWAGRIDREDPRQRLPRQSFEAWCELKQGQIHSWLPADINLVKALGNLLAMAIYQGRLYQKVQVLNQHLQQDIQQRQQAELKISALNAELEQRVLDRTMELQQVNTELLQQVAEREQAFQELQQVEASLENLSRRNQLILNSAGEGIYGVNLQGKITFANPAAARILGYPIEELMGQSMYTLLRHSRVDGTPYLTFESPIDATLRAGTVQSKLEELFYRRDGSSFPVEYVSTPIQEQNYIIGAVVTFKDITDRRLVEQMKDEFVSVVSHELRTPLTSIRSTLGLLASGWLDNQPEKSRRMLEIASTNTNRLVRLLNDILDVERIKFGKVPMDKTICHAAELMLQSVDGMRATAEKAGITLSVLPLTVDLWVDCDRIIQTFTNLLSNAIKFSPAGSTVSLTGVIRTQPALNQAEVLFQVKDAGIGIPEDKLELIFDRFQQVDASISRNQGGTGLGLTICREIVNQHRGKIWVESQLGKGSTFCFTLPLVNPPLSEPSQSEPSQPEPEGDTHDSTHFNY